MSLVDANEQHSPKHTTPLRQKKDLGHHNKVGFLELPLEIRQPIYDMILRPYPGSFQRFYIRNHKGQTNAVGCTKILVLNKQIYFEAKAVLEQMKHELVIIGAYRNILRHPLANGKPSFFRSHARSSATQVPDRISELELVNLRAVTINVNEDIPRKKILQLTRIVKKSHTLQDIYLKCQVRPGGEVLVERLKSNINPLMLCCTTKNIKVTTKAYEDYNDGSLWSAMSNDNQRRLVEYINSFSALDASDEAVHQAEAKAEADPPHASVLTPECRFCYAIFATKEDLQGHLTRLPKHAISFEKKAYNPIHPLATHGGGRHACVVCGVSYYSRATLDSHVEKTSHYRDWERQGIVPRFRKDNWWFTAKLNR